MNNRINGLLGLEWQHQRVSIHNIVRHPRAQRSLNTPLKTRVRALAEKAGTFDRGKFGTPHVCPGPDGVFYAVDGATRVEWAQTVYPTVELFVNCLVAPKVLTDQEAAEVFSILNADRKEVSQGSMIHVGLLAERPRLLEAQKQWERLPGVTARSPFLAILKKRNGSRLLRETVDVFVDWGWHKQNIPSYVISGMAHRIHADTSSAQVRRRRYIREMGPSELSAKAKLKQLKTIGKRDSLPKIVSNMLAGSRS